MSVIGCSGSFAGPDSAASCYLVEAADEDALDLLQDSADDLIQRGRLTLQLAWPRQLAMYLAREHTDASLPAIGRALDTSTTTLAWVLNAFLFAFAAPALYARDTAARRKEMPNATTPFRIIGLLLI